MSTLPHDAALDAVATGAARPRIHLAADYDSMSRIAAARVLDAIADRNDLLICAPTGDSPTGLYRMLAERRAENPAHFEQVRVIKLDEWLGIPPDDPATCEHYLRTNLLDPLRITADRYTAWQGDCDDPVAECNRMQDELARRGPIDLCILGLGRNGHVGFNEPRPLLSPHCHVARLSEATQRHPMLRDRAVRPAFGVTLGIADLLNAREILLLVTGAGKERVKAQLLAGRVTTAVPATLLLLHPNLHIVVDTTT